MRRHRALAVAAVTASLLIGSAASALAYDGIYPTNNYHPTCVDGTMGDTYCLTDNTYVTAYRKSGQFSQGGLDNIAEADSRYDTGTVLEFHFTGTDGVQYSGDAETDIIYEVHDVPGALLGITWCDDSITQIGDNRRCDQHYVAFPANYPSLNTACHETGHAVGLTHGVDAYPSLSNHDDRLRCMTTGPIEFDTVGADNKEQIKGQYS